MYKKGESLVGLTKFKIDPFTKAFSLKLEEISLISVLGLCSSFLHEMTLEDFEREAKFIQENLTDKAIETAFNKFPIEVQNAQLENVKAILKERRSNLASIANRYYDHLSKLVILKGTDKDDHFEITREENGTRVRISRIKDGEIKKPFIDRLLLPEDTKELWIYGLDDDDTSRVS